MAQLYYMQDPTDDLYVRILGDDRRIPDWCTNAIEDRATALTEQDWNHIRYNIWAQPHRRTHYKLVPVESLQKPLSLAYLDQLKQAMR